MNWLFLRACTLIYIYIYIYIYMGVGVGMSVILLFSNYINLKCEDVVFLLF